MWRCDAFVKGTTLPTPCLLSGCAKDVISTCLRSPSGRTLVVHLYDEKLQMPQLFRDLVSRLRNPLPLGTRALVSPSSIMLMSREGGLTLSTLGDIL